MGLNSAEFTAARSAIKEAEDMQRQLQEDARIRALAGLIIQKATDDVARWRMRQSVAEILVEQTAQGKVFRDSDMPSALFEKHPVYRLPGNVYELARELDENWRERITQAVDMANGSGLLGEYSLEAVFEGAGVQFSFSVVLSS